MKQSVPYVPGAAGFAQGRAPPPAARPQASGYMSGARDVAPPLQAGIQPPRYAAGGPYATAPRGQAPGQVPYQPPPYQAQFQPASQKSTRSTGYTKPRTTTETEEIIFTQPSTWCWPFIIFVILFIISLIIKTFFVLYSKNMTFTSAFGIFLFDILWYLIFGAIIYYLCSIGHVGLAWGALVISFLLSFLFFAFIMSVIGAFELGMWFGNQPMTPAPLTPSTPTSWQ